MKNFIRIFALVSAVFSAVMCVFISSCSEDEDSNKPQEKVIKSVDGWAKYGNILKDSASANIHQNADGSFKILLSTGLPYFSPLFTNVTVVPKADSMVLHAQNQVYDTSDDKTLTLSLEGFIRPDSDIMFVKVFGAELSDTIYFATDSLMLTTKAPDNEPNDEKHEPADADLVAKVSGSYVGDCVADSAAPVDKTVEVSLTEKGYFSVELKQCKFVDKMPMMDIALPNMNWSKSGDAYEFWGNTATYNMFGTTGDMPVEVTGKWKDGQIDLALVMVMNGVNHSLSYKVTKQ
ncbi:MAG: hypothetical protein MJZ24_10530 [Paludibacteraceae bacterium]|nr:hypothetical protein [Candidatus Physcocola equi]MCQ2235158.1 hypothetical protein [Paludibacteraceae bacterium]